ncbi:MAG: RHS repeat-associated core domain-containing protein [Chloroflexi bacterium]|nr:RHS repeat-associated core domain-containing protein [Chloroflexota bacterium]
MGKYTIPQTMKVEYFLSDHLGSTSISTDTAGVKVSEMRYKPWGEVRYAWTNDTLNANSAYALTRYTFTGQYSHMDDPSTPASEGFGLMHYGARMYDPALGRFTSADTIVPGGVQGYDRYAYVNNSPVNYTDPSGHISMCGASCETEYEKPQYSIDDVLAKYGVKLKGKWDIRYKAAVVLGVLAVAGKFGEVSGKSPSEIFKTIYGQLTFTWGSCNDCNGAGGYTYGRSDIRFVSMSGFNHSDWLLRARNNVIHELGHAFNWAMNQTPELRLTNDMGFDELLLRDPDSNSYSGFASRNNERTWVQNPATTASEVFADQFLGWTMNKWQTDAGNRYGKWTVQSATRANWMTTNMAEWLYP